MLPFCALLTAPYPRRRIGLRSTWLSDQIRYVPFAKATELQVWRIYISPLITHRNSLLQKSGEISNSLAADLIDEFGPSDDARDALAVLYSGGVFKFLMSMSDYLYSWC